MEQNIIDYDFNEEALGFEEPDKAPEKPLGTGESFLLPFWVSEY